MIGEPSLRHKQRQAVDVIGAGRGHAGRAGRRQFVAVEDHIDLACFQQRRQIVPGRLKELGGDADLGRQCLGQIDFEADDRPRIGRIGIDVGPTPFGIASPNQMSTSADVGQRIGARDGPHRPKVYQAGDDRKRQPKKHALLREPPRD